ncbi:hypothetical protein CDV36_009799 [Fusarium kuroshium]|uniref:Helicase-associated domain-containing protein n=1 Tax=Fusarium kuroshium TaxID=2010991 RepID=A0A3M2S033_9HYPO|nr:hypothetical protein CDV36_009799 [Fusarium kuroshium]
MDKKGLKISKYPGTVISVIYWLQNWGYHLHQRPPSQSSIYLAISALTLTPTGQGSSAIQTVCHRVKGKRLSDHITQLQAFHQYIRVKAGREDLYGHNYFLNRRVLKETLRLRDHITRTVQTLLGRVNGMNFEDKQYTDKICKEMARSLFYNTGLPRSREQGSKGKWPRTVHRNHHAARHPGSALIDIKHEWVIFNKFMNSWSRQYLQSITAIKPEWIIDLPYFEDKMLSRKRSEALRQPYVKTSLDQDREKLLLCCFIASIEQEGVALGKFMHTGSRQYLQTVAAIKPELIIDLPYFRNEKLARKGNGALRQPHVKESLERWQIPDGLTMKDWKIRCITNFDLHERRLTDTDNNDELIAVARRRITQ